MDILDLVFPKKCLECGKEGKYICPFCLSKVKRSKLICPNCEKPSIDGVTHFKCKKKLGLAGLVSIWEYDGVVRKAILALKYKFALEIAKELSEIFVESLHTTSYMLPTTVVLIPIPLHWYRDNWRGFNQSEKIGELVAKEMDWQYVPDLIVRKKSTTPQTELKGKDRVKNVKGIFSLNTKYKILDTSKTIVLLDDVWTTGSTIKEAVKVLKRSGAKTVWGLTIAR